MTKTQKPNGQFGVFGNLDLELIWDLGFGICCLFVIWDFDIGILKLKQESNP